MILKGQMNDDLSIFFDLDEMAESHILTVNGEAREISVIVDGIQGQRNSLKAAGGTYDGDLLFYAKKKDVSGVVQGSAIQFDGAPWIVSAVIEEGEISQVTLSAGAGGF